RPCRMATGRGPPPGGSSCPRPARWEVPCRWSAGTIPVPAGRGRSTRNATGSTRNAVIGLRPRSSGYVVVRRPLHLPVHVVAPHRRKPPARPSPRATALARPDRVDGGGTRGHSPRSGHRARRRVGDRPPVAVVGRRLAAGPGG